MNDNSFKDMVENVPNMSKEQLDTIQQLIRGAYTGDWSVNDWSKNSFVDPDKDTEMCEELAPLARSLNNIIHKYSVETTQNIEVFPQHGYDSILASIYIEINPMIAIGQDEQIILDIDLHVSDIGPPVEEFGNSAMDEASAPILEGINAIFDKHGIKDGLERYNYLEESLYECAVEDGKDG